MNNANGMKSFTGKQLVKEYLKNVMTSLYPLPESFDEFCQGVFHEWREAYMCGEYAEFPSQKVMGQQFKKFEKRYLEE